MKTEQQIKEQLIVLQKRLDKSYNTNDILELTSRVKELKWVLQ